MYAQTININDNQVYALNIPRLIMSLTHALIIAVRLLTRVYGTNMYSQTRTNRVLTIYD